MLQQVVAERPDYAGAWYNYALLLQKLSRVPEAEAAMRRALELWPERADLWLRQAELLKSLQRLPESEARAAPRAGARAAPARAATACSPASSATSSGLDEALQVLAAGREYDSDGYTRACELFMLNFDERICDRGAVRAAQGVRRRARAPAPGALRALRPARATRSASCASASSPGDFREHPDRLDVRAAARAPRPLALRGLLLLAVRCRRRPDAQHRRARQAVARGVDADAAPAGRLHPRRPHRHPRST